MIIYQVFGQLFLIRLWIPLLDFEDRKSYTMTIEMHNFVLNQAMYLLLILVVGIYIKSNFYFLMTNMLVSIIFI